MNTFFYDSYQLILFFFIPGFVLGGIYDMFRILRTTRTNPKEKLYTKIQKHFRFEIKDSKKNLKRKHNTLIFIEDFIFCIIGALIEILLFYHLNDGYIRIYAILISMLGFFIYQNSIGRLTIHVTRYILNCVRALVYYISIILLTPFVYIYKTQKTKRER